MEKNTSIVLGDYFERFIANVLDSGEYKTVSEVIRAGLRLLEERETKEELLLKALKEGEESGFVKDFNPEILLKEIHKKHGII
ncbi:MAG TPA: type II toxin-antitoxin system ParD family antitoxin [Bacteroidetes bacterium]|nr:type II toxin-antitoxin system ParD family antitoxin [Bacteroidota bacterium]